MKRRSGARIAWLLIGACSAADIGCADSVAKQSVTSRIALVLPDGAMVTSIGYTVSSADGTPLVTGTQSVSYANASLAIDLTLPPGQGDVLAMSATVDGDDLCSGTSAAFDVVAGQPTQIALTLFCLVPPAGNDHCPTVASWNIAPIDAGGGFDLQVEVTDPDAGDTLSYSWTAAAGSFDAPSSASTGYECGDGGAQTVTLSVDDDHAPLPCTATVVLPVGCSPASL